MGELDAGHCALLAHEAEGAREGFDVAVVPEAEVVRADASLGHHRGRLGDHGAGAALREAAEVDQVPVGGDAVHARVLAHRGHDDAVAQAQVAYWQGIEEASAHESTSANKGFLGGGYEIIARRIIPTIVIGFRWTLRTLPASTPNDLKREDNP